MTTFIYSELFEKNYISSTSELVLTVAIARELGRRGHCLDMRGVMANLSILSESEKMFMECVAYEGSLILASGKLLYKPVSSYYINLNLMDFPELFIDEGDRRVWTVGHATHTYPHNTVTYMRNIKYFSYALLAKHLTDVLLGEEDRVLEFRFTNNDSSVSALYTHIFMIQKTLPLLEKHVSVDIDIAEEAFDFNMLLHSSIDQGHNRYLTAAEKLTALEECGYRVGGIYVLWSRGRMTANNPNGKITDRHVVRFDGFSSDSRGNPNMVLNFKVFPEIRTMEEKYLEFLDIDPEFRGNFTDLLSRPDPGIFRTESISVYDISIDNYINAESYFLLKLDEKEVVEERTVSVVNEGGSAEFLNADMLAVDLIYWALNQWGVEFDNDLYVDQYYEQGVSPLFNVLNPAIIDFTDALKN